jgi:hypothetical protein
MRQPYIDNIEQINKSGILDPGEKLYDYSYDFRVDAYDDFFENANHWLQRQAVAQQFPACFLYFRSDDTTNAFARSKPTHKRIAFTHGMIQSLYDYYHQQEDLLNSEEFSDAHKVLDRFNNPYWYALFQFWQMFITYHEYGHLVQRGRDAEVNYKEFNHINADNIMESHALELDADYLAASQVAVDILGICSDSGILTPNAGEIGTLCSVALASTFVFFMKTAGYYDGVYFLKNEHPHPYVRLMWVTNILLDTIAKSLPNITIDYKSCTERALEIADRLMEGDYKNPSQTFKQEMNIHYVPLMEHLEAVVKKIKSIKTLCYNLQDDQLPN